MKYLGKKILMIMMAVSLVLAAVPYRSLTAQERFLVVGEVEVTDDNKDDILSDGGRAKFDPATGVLTFADPYIDPDLAAAVYAEGMDIIIEGSLNAVAENWGIAVEDGTLTIRSGNIHAQAEIGIYCKDLIIEGGTLTAQNEPGSESQRAAVLADGNVKVNGGEMVLTARGSNCYGILSSGDVIVSSGKVTIDADGPNSSCGIRAGGKINVTGGEVKAVAKGSGGSLTEAYALWAGSTTVIDGGTVYAEAINDDYNARAVRGNAQINGGDITIKAQGTYGYGFSYGNLKMSDGTLTVESKGSEYCHGINSNNVEISGGQVDASAQGPDSSAIDTTGNIIISGGQVDAKATGEGATAISCWDFSAGSKIEISNAQVTATGSGKRSFGIFTNQPLTINSGTVKGKGDNYGIYSERKMTIGNGISSVTGDGSEKAIYTENKIELGNELTIKEPGGGKLNDEQNTIVEANGITATHALIINDNKYVITIAETQNGSVSSSKSKANEGDVITLTVSPDADCELDSLKVTDANGSEVALRENTDGYEFTMPAADVTVTAAFTKYYTVTVDGDAAQFVTVDPEKAAAGDTVTITRNEVEGFVIKEVTVSDAQGNEVTLNEDNTFTMPASAVTVSVRTVRVFTLTFDLNGGTYNGSTEYVLECEEGDVIEMPKPSRKGYNFHYWQGSKYYAGDSYTVTEDHDFKAIWKKKPELDPSGEPIAYSLPKTGIE